MIKRMIYPIWKYHELEAKLAEMERNGLRLEEVSGFWKFRFKPCVPREVQYFITYSYGNHYMMLESQDVLKSDFRANIIKGDISYGMGIIKIFRITMSDCDLRTEKIYQNTHLRRVIVQKLFSNLFFLALPLLTFCSVYWIDVTVPFSATFHFWVLALVAAAAFPLFIYHLIGLIVMKKRFSLLTEVIDSF